MSGYEWIATMGVGLAILIGIAGTFLPILPGLFLVWGALIVYGLLVGFGGFGWAAVLAATGLLGMGLYLSVRIPQRHAAESGLGIRAQLFGLALAVVGFFLIPVVGFPAGFVAGVFLVRLQKTGNSSEAWSSTKRAIGSIIRASAAQAACGVGMLVIWLGWVGWVAVR